MAHKIITAVKQSSSPKKCLKASISQSFLPSVGIFPGTPSKIIKFLCKYSLKVSITLVCFYYISLTLPLLWKNSGLYANVKKGYLLLLSMLLLLINYKMRNSLKNHKKI